MSIQRTQGYPVLIIGAGRGGAALLEMFLEDSLVKVVAIADTNPEAPGIKLAKEHGIPTYTDRGQGAESLQGPYRLHRVQLVARRYDRRRSAQGVWRQAGGQRPRGEAVLADGHQPETESKASWRKASISCNPLFAT